MIDLIAFLIANCTSVSFMEQLQQLSIATRFSTFVEKPARLRKGQHDDEIETQVDANFAKNFIISTGILNEVLNDFRNNLGKTWGVINAEIHNREISWVLHTYEIEENGESKVVNEIMVDLKNHGNNYILEFGVIVENVAVVAELSADQIFTLKITNLMDWVIQMKELKRKIGKYL